MRNPSRFAVILAVICCCATSSAQIGDIGLHGCSAAKLKDSDKLQVANFLNKIHGLEDSPDALKPDDIQEFDWVDLAGDGRCELVMALRFGPNSAALEIDWQDHSQVLPGGGSPTKGIKDLDGDGKKEIVMYSYLDPAGDRAAAGVTPAWAQVYRLQGEKYVPASNDFPDFYESEVLPKLDREIGQTPYPGETVIAALQMERDKILRVLVRDPSAGLERARQWAKSDNPEMIEDARDVFLDIGGHEAEARAAAQAQKQAFRRWMEQHPYN